ncbi:hypothetical protein BD309DRAFT_877454, partial [Dichomitus squalens]
PVEIKTRKKGDIRDPFEDPKADDDEDLALTSSLEPKSCTRKAVRGQLTSYADLLFTVQQRVCIFMLFVIGRRFRILRWDRAGVIVTKSIDYFEDWNPLCNFFWCISRLPDNKLGFDPTATRLFETNPEWEQMDTFATALESDVSSEPRPLEDGELELESEIEDAEGPGFVFDYVRQMFARSLKDPRWPRFKLRVPDSGKTRDYLVGKPTVYASGAIGRGTRGYVGLDVQTGRFVWLKDAWRASYDEMEKEGTIVERLNHAGITGVPTVICHGDVGRQRTATAAWWECKNLRGVKKKFEDDSTDAPAIATDSVHMVAQVCINLKKFKTGRQLASIIYDCFETHRLAANLENNGILHRDITDDNIVIYPGVGMKDGCRQLLWRGILTDWEISKPIAVGVRPRARQPERTATFQFMSANLLNAVGPVSIPDELESFILIIIYYATRYLESNILHDTDVASFLDECFDCYTIDGDAILCGERKLSIVVVDGRLLR